MNGNYFCHVCGGLVDLIKLQPSDVRLCECEKRFARLRAENERLKAELKAITFALDDPRIDLTMTAVEVIAEAKKDAELWREREAKIKSLKERGFLKSPLRDGP